MYLVFIRKIMSPHNHIMSVIYEKGKDWGPGSWSGGNVLVEHE